MRRLSVVLGLMAVLLVSAGGPALADAPFGVSGRVTDLAGVLSSADKDRVEQAIDELQKNEGLNEYVVFVDSFDGLNGKQWVAETAEQSGLGANDVMLAVAVGERHYGIHPGSAIDTDKLNTVAIDDVEPALKASDWDGAAVALAEGLGGGSGSGASSGALTLLVVVGLIVVAGGSYLFFRSRGRRRRDLSLIHI